tara:strand:- start:736 stop:3210 length:2475 start_codon:yes stop_codon:yes gene_type:complete
MSVSVSLKPLTATPFDGLVREGVLVRVRLFIVGDSAALGAQASFKAQLYAALFARAAMGSDAANQPIFGSQDGSCAQRPLFVAITFCWPEALVALLAAGADPNAAEEFDESGLSTPLMVASGTKTADRRSGQTEMVEALLAARADVDGAPKPFEGNLVSRRVRIAGVVSKPELNGKTGVCGMFDAAKGRYAVSLDASFEANQRGRRAAPISLKAANLLPEDDDVYQETPLGIAASCGDTHLGVVRALLAAGASVTATCSDGYVPLHGACAAGADEVVTALLGAGASVNAHTPHGWTPLHSAAREGRAGTVSRLLAAKADLHRVTEEGYSPLYAASEGGDSAAVSALLEAGAMVDIERLTMDGRTPLFSAAYNGKTGVLKTLLAARAMVSPLTNSEHGYYTPMFAACQNGHVECVSALQGAGALVNDIPGRLGNDSPKSGGASDAYRKDPGEWHLMALLARACENGNAAVVSLLLAAGGPTHDLTIDKRHGRHPLHIACSEGDTEVMRILLDASASVDQQGQDGYRPLQIAAQCGRTSAVRELIAVGADVNATNDDGYAALFMACENDHFESASALLAAGADADPCGSFAGWVLLRRLRPMWIACQNNHLSIVMLLSSYGAARRNIPYSTLHPTWDAYQTAEQLGHTTLYAWLNESSSWTTPLHHVATGVISPERVRTLLRTGADFNDQGDFPHLAPGAGLRGKQESPLSLARAYVSRVATGVADVTLSDTLAAAHLVLQASQPWCPQNHALFPARVRARAVALLRIGYLLFIKDDRFRLSPAGLFDVWIDCIMPLDVDASRQNYHRLGGLLSPRAAAKAARDVD